MCFGCSKEASHGDSSFEYPQHMFWFRKKKKKRFQLCTLILRPVHEAVDVVIGALTLKAPIMTAADDKFCDIFPSF